MQRRYFGFICVATAVTAAVLTLAPVALIAADNGVMPIDQMLVTVTRPIEEAVRTVPGIEMVRSTTSRGSAEIDVFFAWNVNIFQTLQFVESAISRVQPELPPRLPASARTAL